MKKTAAAVAALALCGSILVGCSTAQPTPTEAADAQEKIQVVCATFPAYDWTMQVVGDQSDRFEIVYLMDAGVDLHSYQPSVEDIAAISSCDLFVYVGGESDEWAEDAVEAADNPDLHAISMLEVIGDAAVEEEIVEGMEAVDDHDEKGYEEHGEEGPEYDEHVWLSFRNAQTLVKAIADALSAIDPDNADAYSANASGYCDQLAELDGRYAEAIAAAPKDTVLFCDRFPFRYLVDDYGLSYYAAFVGCSAETEASFETVAFLAQKVDELGLGTVLVIEDSDQAIARTVVANTESSDQTIAVMDSLQSVSAEDIQAGRTYLSAMEENLVVLTGALQ